jgi:hypothetical protein
MAQRFSQNTDDTCQSVRIRSLFFTNQFIPTLKPGIVEQVENQLQYLGSIIIPTLRCYVGVVLNSGEHSQECTDWGGVYDGF